jgi:hypothetical protein
LQDDEYRSVIAVLGARGWAINRQDCGKQMAGDQELLAFPVVLALFRAYLAGSRLVA